MVSLLFITTVSVLIFLAFPASCVYYLYFYLLLQAPVLAKLQAFTSSVSIYRLSLWLIYIYIFFNFKFDFHLFYSCKFTYFNGVILLSRIHAFVSLPFLFVLTMIYARLLCFSLCAYRWL